MQLPRLPHGRKGRGSNKEVGLLPMNGGWKVEAAMKGVETSLNPYRHLSCACSRSPVHKMKFIDTNKSLTPLNTNIAQILGPAFPGKT